MQICLYWLYIYRVIVGINGIVSFIFTQMYENVESQKMHIQLCWYKFLKLYRLMFMINTFYTTISKMTLSVESHTGLRALQVKEL